MVGKLNNNMVNHTHVLDICICHGYRMDAYGILNKMSQANIQNPNIYNPKGNCTLFQLTLFVTLPSDISCALHNTMKILCFGVEEK